MLADLLLTLRVAVAVAIHVFLTCMVVFLHNSKMRPTIEMWVLISFPLLCERMRMTMNTFWALPLFVDKYANHVPNHYNWHLLLSLSSPKEECRSLANTEVPWHSSLRVALPRLPAKGV